MLSEPYAAACIIMSRVSPAGNVNVQLTDSYPEAPTDAVLPTAR